MGATDKALMTVDQADAALKRGAHAMAEKGNVVATSRITDPGVDDYALTKDGRLIKITNVHTPVSGNRVYFGDELGPQADRKARVQDHRPFQAAWRITIGEKVVMPEIQL